MSMNAALVLIVLIAVIGTTLVCRDLIRSRQDQKEWEHCQSMANLGYSQRIVIVTRTLRSGREVNHTIKAWVPKDYTGRASEDVTITSDGGITHYRA